jgi:hypothetical protein
MIIFVILGMWHGASWTYVIFGAMHGFYVVVNHLWRRAFPAFNRNNQRKPLWAFENICSCILTFTAVNFGFVMFRAESVSSAINIYRGMFGAGESVNFPDIPLKVVLCIGFCFALVLIPSNTLQISKSFEPYGANSELSSRYEESVFFSIFIGILLVLSVLKINKNSVFLYFQF